MYKLLWWLCCVGMVCCVVFNTFKLVNTLLCKANFVLTLSIYQNFSNTADEWIISRTCFHVSWFYPQSYLMLSSRAGFLYRVIVRPVRRNNLSNPPPRHPPEMFWCWTIEVLSCNIVVYFQSPSQTDCSALRSPQNVLSSLLILLRLLACPFLPTLLLRTQTIRPLLLLLFLRLIEGHQSHLFPIVIWTKQFGWLLTRLCLRWLILTHTLPSRYILLFLSIQFPIAIQTQLNLLIVSSLVLETTHHFQSIQKICHFFPVLFQSTGVIIISKAHKESRIHVVRKTREVSTIFSKHKPVDPIRHVGHKRT